MSDPFGFRVVAEFPRNTKFAVTKGHLISCEACDYPGTPVLRLTDANGKLGPKLPLPFSKFDKLYGPAFSKLSKRFPDGAKLDVHGSDDGDVYLEVSASAEAEEARLGADSMNDYFEYRGESWAKAEQPSRDTRAKPMLPGSYGHAQLPRKYDDALSQLPFDSQGVLAGGGGPLLALSNKTFAVWRDTRWHTEPAPWWTGSDYGLHRGALRLSDGSTLVQGPKLHLIDREGKVGAFLYAGQQQHPASENEQDEYLWLDVAGQPWLVERRQQARVLAPKGDVRLAIVPKREKFTRRPPPAEVPLAGPAPPMGSAVPADSAGPADSAVPVGSAVPADSAAWVASVPGADIDARASWGSPAAFSSACPAPFVVLSTPPKANWDYSSTAKVLKGLTATPLRFFEVTAPATIYFGAQAHSEADARALISHFEKNIPKSKPQLMCWDIARHVTDRYQPPESIVEVMFNFNTGKQYLFMR
jgi:hypothetical protein